MFTVDEISLIMESLDALGAAAAKDNLLFGMLSIALAPVDEKEKAATEAKNKMDQTVAGHQILEDRIILLKAKLIQLRTTAAIDSVFQGRQE